MSEVVEPAFISASCAGEFCTCGRPAVRKVEEAIMSDDPHRNRHPYTAYVCADHYAYIMGPRAARGLTTTPPVVGEDFAAIADRLLADAFTDLRQYDRLRLERMQRDLCSVLTMTTRLHATLDRIRDEGTADVWVSAIQDTETRQTDEAKLAQEVLESIGDITPEPPSLAAGELTWLRDQVLALCEATEDDPSLAQMIAAQTAPPGPDAPSRPGEHALGYARGRIQEAKGIRRAIAEVANDRLRSLTDRLEVSDLLVQINVVKEAYRYYVDASSEELEERGWTRDTALSHARDLDTILSPKTSEAYWEAQTRDVIRRSQEAFRNDSTVYRPRAR